MSVEADLGEIDGPLLVFGGPYSNLQATRAMRTEAERLGVPPARCLCTGDVVAYCGDPAATVAEIRDWGVPVVMGNCEENLGAGVEDCGCGFEEGSACDVLSRDWYAYARSALDAEDCAWMAALPRRIRFRIGELTAVALHGSDDDISRFIFASTADQVKREALERQGADLVVAGHCGLPFTTDLDGGVWHNAGVIGMPANDGTPDVWFSLITPQAGGLDIARRRLSYDHSAAIAAMARAGLPGAYARSLGDGLWPNMDVLPQHEKMLRGMHISQVSQTFDLSQNAATQNFWPPVDIPVDRP